jgi:hypothetical protein
MGSTIVFAEPKHGKIYQSEAHPKAGGQVRLRIVHQRDPEIYNLLSMFFGSGNLKRGGNVTDTNYRLTYVTDVLGLEIKTLGSSQLTDGFENYILRDTNGNILQLNDAQIGYSFFRLEPMPLPHPAVLVTIE